MSSYGSADSFVSLHTHSHYSLLDGFSTITEYIEEAVRLGQFGLGISDHGSTSSVFELVTESKKQGLTPIPGAEFYVAPDNPDGAKAQRRLFYGPNGEKAPAYDVSANGSYLHQTIWAYNQKGLENLFHLSSLSWRPENYFMKPRIDFNMLAEHNEGLIIATGCPSSEISTRFLLGQNKKAYQYAHRLKEVFGDRLYVEIMKHDLTDPIERLLLPKQLELSKKLDIPLLATNDSHYAHIEDAKYHEYMLAAQSKSKMSEPAFHEGGRRFAFDGSEFYLKSSQEMMSMFPDDKFPDAIKNTRKIAEMATDIEIGFNPQLRPRLDVPDGFTPETYLWHLIKEGYHQKRGNASEEVREESQARIEKEAKVILSEGFVDYFLVVWDYIKYARDNGIGVGDGRGSIGGSEIAYLLDISRTCPIRWNLMFERFLSEGRGATYEVTYDNGEKDTLYVSQEVQTDAGKKYIHQLKVGDEVNR